MAVAAGDALPRERVARRISIGGAGRSNGARRRRSTDGRASRPRRGGARARRAHARLVRCHTQDDCEAGTCYEGHCRR